MVYARAGRDTFRLFRHLLRQQPEPRRCAQFNHPKDADAFEYWMHTAYADEAAALHTKVAAGTCGKGYSSHYLVFATFKIDGVAPLRRPASGGFGFL